MMFLDFNVLGDVVVLWKDVVFGDLMVVFVCFDGQFDLLFIVEGGVGWWGVLFFMLIDVGDWVLFVFEC